ncbi:hypothetical protein PUR23_14435 [Methylorubrum populi]|jgi:hypothetical protein|uniref:Uncharacterized protein n=1 Tax=Methylobacterium brachiatum TaxID=269660 RepID=A0AAJ1WVQ8_9HYPH|nr:MULTISPECIES: hypothetical protein [Methylobacterium]MCB4802796.1 hypothetical protein [Methylobacterium brachiatum]MDQ0543432.1 hypothetical protein [Methylobacterium brachiatum]
MEESLFSDDTMALQFGRRRNPFVMGLGKFRDAATAIGFDSGLLEREVRVTVGKALDRWPDTLRDMPIPPSMKRTLLDRLPRLRLVQEVRPGFKHGTSFDEDDVPPQR